MTRQFIPEDPLTAKSLIGIITKVVEWQLNMLTWHDIPYDVKRDTEASISYAMRRVGEVMKLKAKREANQLKYTKENTND